MSTVFDPVLFGSLGLKVLTAAQQTPQRLAALQATRLARLLQSVGASSAYYRPLLRGRDPSTVRLQELPVVSKPELMQRFDDWVTDPRLKLNELQAFISDRRRIGEPYLDRYLVWESSGTSGEPGIFVQDVQTLAIYDALEALRRPLPRPWQRMLDPLCIAERIAFIGATTGHFASEVSAQRLRRINRWMANAMRSFSILSPTADLVADLNRFEPTVIVTYPTAAALLAEEFGRGTLVIKPKEVWTGGETLSPTVRRRVAQTFGCTVSNSYGTSEFLPIGWECSHGRMHANTDWVLIEPVDAQQRPVPAGEMSHSTLITNLGNEVQPIIRFDIGDRIRVHDEPCGCGSPFPVIEVHGRHDEPLRLLGGDGRLATLLPLALTTVLEDDAQLFHFQLEQRDASTLVLRLPLAGVEGEAALARGAEALRSFARRHGLAPLEVVLECDRALTRGRSGKVQRIIAAPASRRHAEADDALVSS
ncbi:AMP-binding protein [Piscinibacter sp. XHJ-5]|uniref:phenylacetate--CoA ligase family protein n=1 Tax=Piscinibacter sp. XHJ-5 TaxID=3037797 RepID=UPI002452DBD6|nr:AMP-binding protein [Piscinibacter sp. XHJ-5]